MTKISHSTLSHDTLPKFFFDDLIPHDSISRSQLNLETLKEHILEHNFIKQCSLTFIEPDTLHINYELKTPVGYIGDIDGVAFNETGQLFECNEVLRPKKLPSVFLGLNQPLNFAQYEYQLEKSTLKKFQQLTKHLDHIEWIDFSFLDAQLYYQKQIIFVMKNAFFRLKAEPSQKDLNRVMFLTRDNQWAGHIIDLRFDNKAFMRRVNERIS